MNLDEKQALQDLLELLAIPGPSGSEKAVADHIAVKCGAMKGFNGEIVSDNAHALSEFGGDTGNLIIRMGGQEDKPRLLFAAHLDTVPQAVRAEPELRDGMMRSRTEGKSLGGDCRAGCAVLLQLIRRVSESGSAHPPVTAVFTVQEEIGVIGARHLDMMQLGHPGPAMAFNFDGGEPEKIYSADTGAERFHIDITGIASHAALEPEKGVSAAIIAARALSALDRDGWHGKIRKPEGLATANTGVLKGGEVSNVVMPSLSIFAEVRSHDPVFRRLVLEAWKNAFHRAAAETVNDRNAGGRVVFRPGPCYESYALPRTCPAVDISLKAANQCGFEPSVLTGNGGGDTNWLNAHGIPAVALGMGVHACHTPGEYVALREFYRGCRLALSILETA
jgi:tripeptide aminopeptidase